MLNIPFSKEESQVAWKHLGQNLLTIHWGLGTIYFFILFFSVSSLCGTGDYFSKRDSLYDYDTGWDRYKLNLLEEEWENNTGVVCKSFTNMRQKTSPGIFDEFTYKFPYALFITLIWLAMTFYAAIGDIKSERKRKRQEWETDKRFKRNKIDAVYKVLSEESRSVAEISHIEVTYRIAVIFFYFTFLLSLG